VTGQDDRREETRAHALTLFLEARVKEGYLVETRADTHAIIAPARGWSSLNPFRKASGRHVISVDDEGNVTMAPAEPTRS
jgi:hypothetical protein